MGMESLKMLLSQAEDICHCIREARRIFGYRHFCKRPSSQSRCQCSKWENVDGGPRNVNNAELEGNLSLTIIYFSASSGG